MTKKEILQCREIDVMRFFEDASLANEIKLTKEEVGKLDNFEWEVLCANGLRQINGGYAQVKIYDTDEDEEGNEILVLEVEFGEQNTGDGYSNTDTWQVEFNRKTQQFGER